MDGGCVSSPRWVSMLVAEMYYPDTFLPSAGTPTHLREPVNVENPPPVHDFQNYQQYLHKRAGTPEMDMASNYGVTTSASVPTSSPSNSSKTSNAGGKRCDGTDEIGCFQVMKQTLLQSRHMYLDNGRKINRIFTFNFSWFIFDI